MKMMADIIITLLFDLILKNFNFLFDWAIIIKIFSTINNITKLLIISAFIKTWTLGKDCSIKYLFPNAPKIDATAMFVLDSNWDLGTKKIIQEIRKDTKPPKNSLI